MIEELYVVMGLATILFVWLRNRFKRPKVPMELEPKELAPLSPMSVCSEINETHVDKRILKTTPLESPNWDSLIEKQPPSPSTSETNPFTIKKSASWSSLVENLEERSEDSDLGDMTSD